MTLKLIVCSVLAGVFIVWIIKLIAMPDPNRADGCIYKSPGHHGWKRRRWPKQLRKKPASRRGRAVDNGGTP